MRKIVYAIGVLCLVGFASCKSKENSKEEKVTQKRRVDDGSIVEHSCNAQCLDNNHVYFHNEQKHTCSTDCGKTHACNADCKEKAHTYKHGEIGHYCLCPLGKPAI